MFPDVSSPLPDSFQLVSIDTKMSLLIKNQVSALFLRSDNSMSLTSVTWSGGITFLVLTVTDNPNSLPEIKTFNLPNISFATTIKHWSVLPLLIDADIRNVDVVTSAQSNAG